ncbi:hypothetical protein HPB49_001612 [Dermacentor silvarum]|uniref:Uncharacterized protein n=1 Tax=Dermacentor silvarum TaxID=543639 RepID=A0ACB8D238_DERSI|nr:hypothetical protein HPB49_001612 [Dermacentor silvarum]
MASQELKHGPDSNTESEIPATLTPDSPDSMPIDNEILFKLVECRSRKRNANSKMAASTSTGRPTLQNAAAHAAALHGGPPCKPGPIWKLKPLPRLHPEDIAIIRKPWVTPALKDVYKHGELGAAFAAYLGTQAPASLSLLPSWEPNLLVAGTRDPHVADKLPRELAHINKLGNSNVAAHTFVGKVVPRFVHNSEVILLRACKRIIRACGPCGTVGHRAHTCPCPDNEKCGLCGQPVPTTKVVNAPHECTPSSAVCGQAHVTNSRDCTGKFRQHEVPDHKAKRPKTRATRRPNNPPSHPTSEANGGAPRGANPADPKTLSPPPPSVTSAHQEEDGTPTPPPGGKGTRHFTALNTDGAWASTSQHGKQQFRNGAALPAPVKLKPPTEAVTSSLEDLFKAAPATCNRLFVPTTIMLVERHRFKKRLQQPGEPAIAATTCRCSNPVSPLNQTLVQKCESGRTCAIAGRDQLITGNASDAEGRFVVQRIPEDSLQSASTLTSTVPMAGDSHASMAIVAEPHDNPAEHPGLLDTAEKLDDQAANK